ncbi:5398_t:CDS:2, partial [Entrophospora sp. SA101]
EISNKFQCPINKMVDTLKDKDIILSLRIARNNIFHLCQIFKDMILQAIRMIYSHFIVEFYRNGNLPQIFSQSQSILLGPLTELSQFTHTGYNILCWYEKEILENLKSYWPNLILQTEYTEESMRLTICGYVSKKLILKPHHNR